MLSAQVRELSDEYFEGTKGRPPLQLVEQMYGVDARKRGEHWRAAKFHGNSRKFYSEFQKRLKVWSWLEQQEDRENGVAVLEQAVAAQFGVEKPARAHLKWLVETYMPSKKEGFEERSKQAKKNASKRAEKRAAKSAEAASSEEGTTRNTKRSRKKK